MVFKLAREAQVRGRQPQSTLIERLFDSYALNLSAYLPQFQNVFACPLCFRLLGRDSLPTGDITVEHVIPKSLGGRLLTLTCRECNNRDGTLLDAHLVHRFRAQDALAGVSHEPLRSRVRIGDGEMGADLYLFAGNAPRLEIYGVPKVSNPELHAAAVRALDEGHIQGHFSLSLGYKALHSRVAVLRVGYLLMFRHFGYGYILHKSVQQVRHQILNPGQELIASKAVVRLEQPPPEPNGVSLLYSPKNLRCFFVTLDLSTALDRYLGVVLPGLDDQSEQIYDRWPALRENMEDIRFSMTLIPFDPQVVSDPNNVGFPAWIWNNISKT